MNEYQEEDILNFESLPSDILILVCRYLERRDLCDLSMTSKRLFSFAYSDSYASINVWKYFIKRDFNIPYEEQNKYLLPPRQLYISLSRSRISPTDILWPHMQGKRARKDPICIRWAERNGIKPFFVLHLFYKSQKTRRTEAKYTDDIDSYFGKVLEICEMFRIQIEGQIMIRYPSLYKVIWRVKVSVDYLDLGPLSFIVRIAKDGEKCIPFDAFETLQSDNDQSVYTWVVENQVQQDVQRQEQMRQMEDNMRAWNINNVDQVIDQVNINNEQTPKKEFPLGKWFDVVVGKINIESPNSIVFLSLINTAPAWKYGLWIDYVAVVPITKEEYDNLKYGPIYDEDVSNEMMLLI